MALEKVVWQPTWERDTPARRLVEGSPHKGKFRKMLEAFLQQVSSREFVQVAICISGSTVYIDVVHLDWAHYPGRIRAFARRGWGRFMDDLLGYEVPRWSDCGNPEKTSCC